MEVRRTGNTHGRPKAYHTVLRLARANSPEAVRLLVQCICDNEAPWPSRVAAANSILDRAFGRPKEHLQVDGDGINELRIVFVDPRDATDGFTGNDMPALNAELGSDTFEVSFGPSLEDDDASGP